MPQTIDQKRLYDCCRLGLVYDEKDIHFKEIEDLAMKLGKDQGESESSGFTPLHICCNSGHLIIADVLIQHGADVNAKDLHGRSPLIYACYCRYDNP